jgi:N-acetylglucosaminyl-diphospho-decaprenol L-rhamnosyltransferase
VSQPDVSVIVVNFNGRQWLEGCLSAAEAQDGVRAEIILVDNASTDGSAGFVRENFPSVKLVLLNDNRGFAGGSNAGSAAARGRYLAFLNNDARPDRSWLGSLLAALERTPRAAMVASQIVRMDNPTVVDSAGDGWLTAGGAFKRGFGQSASEWSKGGEVFGACGAACLIRREVFERVGGFDESFFVAFEDVDLSYRVRLAGGICIYEPHAVVRHAGSATLGLLSRQAVYFGQRNLEWVYLKNTPGLLLLKTLPGHLIYMCCAALYFLSRGRLLEFVAAKAAAVAGLGAVLRRRRAVQRTRQASIPSLRQVMEPRWYRIKWREKHVEWTPPPSP